MTGNSMKSDLLVESHNRMTTNTTDGRQQGLAIIPGHTIDTNSTNNNNNNTNQTIGISSTSTNSNNSTNNTSSSSSHNNTRMIMSHILSSSVENGDLVAGTNNVVSPDLTLAIQEDLKRDVDFSGLGRELLSRDTNRPHPAAATSSSEGIRGTSSSISINNNNTSNNTTTITTNNNNNNGLYENGSSMDGNVTLPLTTTTGDTRGTVTNMTPSLHVAFSIPTTTSGSSTSSSTTITGSVTTINSYKNNNHNGTAAHPTSTDLNKNNNNLLTNNTTSPDPTSGGCSDPSSNNIHNNSTPVFSINNTGGTSTGPLLPLSTSSDPYPTKQHCPVTDNTSESKLKELLLLHIDFIHHQTDLLLQKDREIGDLKSENETLKCRLDRMERRLSILKQKGEPVNSHHHHHHHHMPKNQANSDALTTAGDRGNKKFNFLKRRERKFGVDAQNLQKKKGGSETTPKSKSQSLTKNRLSYRSNDSVNRCQELSENGDVILRTDNLYYVSYYEPPRPSEKLVVNIRHTNDEINPDGSKVEIPHWRLRPVANCYTLEGTENLEDEVFTKRHQKPELEEKRRKRWDLQRMREQKLFERLREKDKSYPENMKDEHQFITSFYPSLDDITHIEIADKVPVTAFGHPIPYIKPTDFELPWELGEWPSTSSSSGEDNRHQKHRRVKRK